MGGGGEVVFVYGEDVVGVLFELFFGFFVVTEVVFEVGGPLGVGVFEVGVHDREVESAVAGIVERIDGVAAFDFDAVADGFAAFVQYDGGAACHASEAGFVLVEVVPPVDGGVLGAGGDAYYPIKHASGVGERGDGYGGGFEEGGGGVVDEGDGGDVVGGEFDFVALVVDDGEVSVLLQFEWSVPEVGDFAGDGLAVFFECDFDFGFGVAFRLDGDGKRGEEKGECDGEFFHSDMVLWFVNERVGEEERRVERGWCVGWFAVAKVRIIFVTEAYLFFLTLDFLVWFR